MSVYLMAEISVRNGELYSKYTEKTPHVIAKYGGRYLIRGGKVTPIAGNWNPERVILLEFATMEGLQKCIGSEEYLRLARIREQSSVSRAIAVEGVIASK